METFGVFGIACHHFHRIVGVYFVAMINGGVLPLAECRCFNYYFGFSSSSSATSIESQYNLSLLFSFFRRIHFAPPHDVVRIFSFFPCEACLLATGQIRDAAGFRPGFSGAFENLRFQIFQG